MSDEKVPTPLQDAISHLQIPDEELDGGVTKDGIEIDASKRLGKGWSVKGHVTRAWSGTLEWFAGFQWKGKS